MPRDWFIYFSLSLKVLPFAQFATVCTCRCSVYVKSSSWMTGSSNDYDIYVTFHLACHALSFANDLVYFLKIYNDEFFFVVRAFFFYFLEVMSYNSLPLLENVFFNSFKCFHILRQGMQHLRRDKLRLHCMSLRSVKVGKHWSEKYHHAIVAPGLPEGILWKRNPARSSAGAWWRNIDLIGWIKRQNVSIKLCLQPSQNKCFLVYLRYKNRTLHVLHVCLHACFCTCASVCVCVYFLLCTLLFHNEGVCALDNWSVQRYWYICREQTAHKHA